MPASGLGLRAELRKLARAQFPGASQTLAQATQGLRTRTRVPEGPVPELRGLRHPGTRAGDETFALCLSFYSGLLPHLPKELPS